MMEHPAPDSPECGVDVSRAEHAGEGFAAEIDASRATLRTPGGLEYLAHYSAGILDFDAVALGRPRTPAVDRETLRRVSRKFTFMVTSFEHWCEPLRSGELIRVVLQGASGALFYYLTLDDRIYVGWTGNGSQSVVDQADKQLKRQVEEAMRQIDAPGRAWGGMLDADADDQPAERPPLTFPDVIRSGWAGHARVATEALSPRDLQFACLYHEGELVFSADILQDPRVPAAFFQQISPDARRARYYDLARNYWTQTGRLGQLLSSVGCGELTRCVLDVERGALYAMPVAEGAFLLAVTLNQNRVHAADVKVRSAALELRALPDVTG